MKKERMISCIILIFIDQLVKFLITNNTTLNTEVVIIPKFFYLTNVLNTGGAFSILSGNTIILAIIGLIVLFFLIKYLNNRKLSFFTNIAYGILLGGIISNIIDRICLNGVRDYIGIKIFSYNYPIFNIADMGIVIGAILIVLFEYRGEIHGNRSK